MFMTSISSKESSSKDYCNLSGTIWNHRRPAIWLALGRSWRIVARFDKIASSGTFKGAAPHPYEKPSQIQLCSVESSLELRKTINHIILSRYTSPRRAYRGRAIEVATVNDARVTWLLYYTSTNVNTESTDHLDEVPYCERCLENSYRASKCPDSSVQLCLLLTHNCREFFEALSRPKPQQKWSGYGRMSSPLATRRFLTPTWKQSRTVYSHSLTRRTVHLLPIRPPAEYRAEEFWTVFLENGKHRPPNGLSMVPARVDQWESQVYKGSRKVARCVLDGDRRPKPMSSEDWVTKRVVNNAKVINAKVENVESSLLDNDV